jgi:proline iminopeptidase
MRYFVRIFLAALLVAWLPLAGHAQSSNATGTFTSAGATLAFHRYGHGPVVVILAGGPGLNALYMKPVAQTIARDGYTAILLDQRGTGSSVAAGAQKKMLTVAGTVADIDALRVALGQKKLVLVTHSFGGGMALAYTAAHPDRVTKLILSGSVGTDLSSVDLFGKRLNERMTPAERTKYAAYGKSGNDAEQLNIQLLAEFDDRAKARKLIATLPQPFIYPAVTNAIYTDFSKHYNVAAKLGAYRGPVTLLTGTDDAAVLMEPSLRVAFPNATVVHIANSGHWPWLENPVQFDPALRTALAQ